MPRPSLSYEAVETAATNLVKSGETPTLRAVRDALGGGSMTSIQPLLKKWSDTQAPKASAASFEVPARLRDALAAEFARVAADARVESEAKLLQAEADITGLAADGQRAEEELESAREELTRITTERDTLAGKNSEQSDEIERLKSELARAREETDDTRQKLARAEIRLEALEGLQEQNEALRTAAAEANERAAQAEKTAAVAEAKADAERDAKGELHQRALDAETRTKAANDHVQELLARNEALHERLIASVNAESEMRTNLNAARAELAKLATTGENGPNAAVDGEASQSTAAAPTDPAAKNERPSGPRKK